MILFGAVHLVVHLKVIRCPGLQVLYDDKTSDVTVVQPNEDR